MHITLDNAFAFSILVLILITFMGYVIPTAYLSFTTVREHQLDEVAQSIMDKILLSPGIPENWGDIHVVQSDNDLKAFGLQKAGGDPYELDVNKILRIASVNTSTIMTLPKSVRINVTRIAELLGLGNEYGFSIRVTPALNISYEILDWHRIKQKGHDEYKNGFSFPSKIRVTVKTPEGRPALGANVTGLYILVILVDIEGNPNNPNEDVISDYTCSFKTNVTDWKGGAELDFKDFLESISKSDKSDKIINASSVLVVYADYYGIRAINPLLLYSNFGECVNGTLIDNYLIVEFEESVEFPNGTRKPVPESGLANPPYYIYLSELENVTDHGNSGRIINKGNFRIRVYKLSSVIDDDVVLIMQPISVPIPHIGRKYVIVNFFRSPSNVICQKGSAAGNIKTSVLRRMVRVGSFHYIFEVRVWRWGEG